VAKLPEPPRPLTTPPETKLISAGTRLWRIYQRGGKYPASFGDFRFFGPTGSRFDHHEPPPRLQAHGIFYAADDPTTCLAETFQVTRVIDRNAGDPWLVGFETAIDLTLLDLTGAWPTRAGASMAINSGPRPRARRWSQAIYGAYATVVGLWYASSMHANQPSVALYERAARAVPGAPSFHRALSDPAILRRVDAAAVRLGYRLV
jgi:hypothetical protein